jgi:hypothetical protein
MLLYTVTYPGQRTMDKDVPWTYLQGLASQGKRHNGAVATCTNGEPKSYVLRDGEWADAPKD